MVLHVKQTRGKPALWRGGLHRTPSGRGLGAPPAPPPTPAPVALCADTRHQVSARRGGKAVPRAAGGSCRPSPSNRPGRGGNSERRSCGSPGRWPRQAACVAPHGPRLFSRLRAPAAQRLHVVRGAGHMLRLVERDPPLRRSGGVVRQYHKSPELPPLCLVEQRGKRSGKLSITRPCLIPVHVHATPPDRSAHANPRRFGVMPMPSARA